MITGSFFSIGKIVLLLVVSSILIIIFIRRRSQRNLDQLHHSKKRIKVQLQEELVQEVLNSFRELNLEKQKIEEEKSKLNESKTTYLKKLELLSHCSPEEALKVLKEEITQSAASQLEHFRRETFKANRQEIEKEGKNLLLDILQRLSRQTQTEFSATTVLIPSETFKGRLIGREGRNIKCFEHLTGVTLLIDDTSESVLISSYDPARREIAKRALTELISDGRISPSNIETIILKTQQNFDKENYELGKNILNQFNLKTNSSRIPLCLGKLNYRLSYGQNTLHHSQEVAECCGLLAAEMGFNVELALRSGLFHDIGKVIEGTASEETVNHAQMGAFFLREEGEVPLVVEAVQLHHETYYESSNPYGAFVRIADSLSSSRPGARSESAQAYFQRLYSLENLILKFPGVEKSFAINGGREVRVFVKSNEVKDEDMPLLAKKIRNCIEDGMQFPDKIRIVLLRENRCEEWAY